MRVYNVNFFSSVGYIEIFNETVFDLLNRRQTVQVTRNSESCIKLSNKEVIVKDAGTTIKLLQKGNDRKAMLKSSAQTQSSHTIFQIVSKKFRFCFVSRNNFINFFDQIIESLEVDNGPVKVGRLNLVDLDRSEGAEVKTEKGNRVDKSLEWLGHAMTALSKGERFRDFSKSKLTRILKDYLDDNSNIALICSVNPISLKETIATLR